MRGIVPLQEDRENIVAAAGTHRKRMSARSLGAALAGLLLAAAPAAANPLGGQVVGGQATIATTAPGTLTIQQSSQRAAINWQSFNIAPAETTRFVQPSASSIALNRVTAGDPSVIAGKLTANGQLVLVNPSGIVFTRGAQVNVNSLIATPTDISTADFMAGRMNFSIPSTDPHARIVNNGQITVAEKGLAALVGPGVANNGVIAARLGTVVLGGAQTYTLDFYGDGLIKFAVGSPVTSVPLGADGKPLASLVSNAGQINAAGGTVLLTANAAAGILSTVVDAGGTINAPNYAHTPATVTIDAGAGNRARLGGTIDVSGLGAGEVGGRAIVTGGSVELAGTARIDARGAAGGGTVSVGGGPHGTDPLVRNALATNVSAGAQIDASATDNGKGGIVAVWSDGTTTFDGTILAKGGANGGDGGWVETSGQKLAIGDGAVVNTLATAGATGTWLLDPAGDLTVANAGGDFTPAEFVSFLHFSQRIRFADNDIIVSDAIDATGDAAATGYLFLFAGRSIAINAEIKLNGGSFGGTANDSANLGTGLADRLVGAGNITVASGAAIDTTVGNKSITLNIDGFAANTGGGGDFTPGSISLTGGLHAGSGTVSLSSAGTISESGSGAVSTTAALTTSSVGGTTLGGANTVGGFNATNTSSGDISLTNTASLLTVTGISQSGGGDVTINTTGDLALTGAVGADTGTVALISTGAITQTGGVVTGGTLFVTASTGIGTASNPLQTQVGTLGADTDTGGIFVNNGVTTPITLAIAGSDGVQVTGAAGDIQLVNQGTIDVLTDGDTIRGPGNITVKAEGAAADIQTGGQPASLLTSIRGLGSGLVDVEAGRDILLGDAGVPGPGSVRAVSGSITLNAGRNITVTEDAVVNVIGGSGGIGATAGGDITMTTASGSMPGAPEIFTAGGPIALTTGAGKALTLVSSGVDAISSSGGNITLTTDALTIGQAINAVAGTVTIAPATPGLAVDVGTSTGKGHLVLDPTTLSAQVTAATLAIGSGTAGDITVNGALDPANIANLTLNTGGTITQTAAITTGTLSGSAAAATLGIAGNSIATLGDFTTTTGDFALVDGRALAVTGSVSSAGKLALETTGGSFDITLSGSLAASSGTVSLNSAGAIRGAGAIDPGSLLILSAGSVSLTGANTVDNLAAHLTGIGSSLTFNNTGNPLTVATVNNGVDSYSGIGTNGGAVTLTTTTSGNLTLNQPIDTTNPGGTVAAPATVRLAVAGTITQNAGAVITAGALTGSSVGGASLGEANAVKTFGSFSNTTSGLLTFNDGQSFSTGGTISSAGDLTLTTTTTGAGSNMTLTNELSAVGGTVTLNSAGSISQTGGFIIAKTLTGSSDGGADFGRSNEISKFGPFTDTGGGAITLLDGETLTVAGALKTTGNVSLFAAAGGDPDLIVSSSVSGATVTLFAAGNITETAGGSITGTNLIAVTEATPGGSITLDQASANTVSGNVTLASLTSGDMPGKALGSGAIRFTDTVGFTIAAATTAVPSGATLALEDGISTTGTVAAGTAGNLTIAAGAGVTGSSVTLGTSGNFTNNAGAGAISIGKGGRWLIYSTDPNLDADGGLTPDFIQYAASFTVNALSGTAPAAAGNGFLYSLAPVFKITGVTKVYDSTTALPGSPAAFTTTGVVAGDTVTTDFSPVVGSYADANVGGGIDVTLTALPTITSASRGGIPIFGYTVGAVKDDPIGTITPAALTVTATDQSKTYGQTASLGTTGFTSIGLLGGDKVSGVTLASTGAAATAGVADYPIVASAALGSGLGNYTISYVNGGLTVNPAALTITASDQSKTYGQALVARDDGVHRRRPGQRRQGQRRDAGQHRRGGDGGSGRLPDRGQRGARQRPRQLHDQLCQRRADGQPGGVDDHRPDQSKTYGQALSLGTTAFTASGLVNGDTVSGVTQTSTGAAATAGVADYPIVASAALGSGLGNYTISYVNGGLSVNPAALTITASDQSKTYGQALSLGTTAFTAGGLVNGDKVSGVTLASTGAAATAGVADYPIVASAALGSGLGNYTISYVNGGLTVTPAALTITASDQSKTYGQALSLGTTAFTAGGLVNGDKVSGVTQASTGAAATAGVADYPIVPSAALGSGLGNYTISYVNGGLSVNPAALTITAWTSRRPTARRCRSGRRRSPPAAWSTATRSAA